MQWAMRLSPTKTTILMKKNPGGSWKPDEEDYTQKKEDDLMEHQIGIQVRPKNNTGEEPTYVADPSEDLSDRVTEGGDILVDDYGRPLVNREIAYLPDPRYREPAHLAFSLLWYGGCIASILYIIFVFATYTPEQTQTFPFTSSLDPLANIRLEVSCTQTSQVVIRGNYSNPSSPCYSKGASIYDEPAATGAPLSASQEASLPHIQWLNLDAQWPLVTETGSNIPTSGSTSVEIPVCHHEEETYDGNDFWPTLPGMAVMLGNISEGEMCSIDIYPTGRLLGSGGKPLKRISIEGSLLKTVWFKYTEKRLKHEDKKLDSEWINVDFYEMDTARKNVWGTYPSSDPSNPNATGPRKATSSIVRFRLMDTSTSIMEFDMRDWLLAGGIFGSLWYLVSNYFCFYAAPLLLCAFPRDFIADAKNGKLDGYTQNGLAQAWKPTVWLWIGGELVKRIKFATGP